jgi:hypothetical protein
MITTVNKIPWGEIIWKINAYTNMVTPSIYMNEQYGMQYSLVNIQEKAYFSSVTKHVNRLFSIYYCVKL